MDIKYDKIGINYNSSRQADQHLSNRIIHHLKPIPNGCYLDIGCGTGNYTIELHKRTKMCIGIDPSVEMLKVAKSNNRDITWKRATAEDTGLADKSIDGIIAHLTIHHWSKFNEAIQEQYRILKPGGTMVIFSSSPEQMRGYWLNHYFPKMMEDSMIQMPDQMSVKDALQRSGFEAVQTEKYFVKKDLQDKFLYCGKHAPELYLDENIRHGISSFSSLANKEEITNGLIQLRKDIKSGLIVKITDSYESDTGDYLYIIAKKNSH